MGPAAARSKIDAVARPQGKRTEAPAAAGRVPSTTARPQGIEVRVSYAGECSLEEAVSRYLAARANAGAIPALAEAGA